MGKVQILTIITPSYEKVGREMVRRFKRFTGHDVKVIECPDSDGFKEKLNLDRHAGRRRVIWADCDLWPLRHWNPDELHLGNCIQGAFEHAVFNNFAFPNTDCQTHNLDWSRHINTGLVFLNGAMSEHRDMFKMARQLWKDREKGLRQYADVTEQTMWNQAIQNLGLPVQFLPEVYNFYTFAVRHGQRPFYPREIINLHGAGIPAKKKYSRLKIQASVFSETVYPMCQDAVNWEHAKMFNLR